MPAAPPFDLRLVFERTPGDEVTEGQDVGERLVGRKARFYPHLQELLDLRQGRFSRPVARHHAGAVAPRDDRLILPPHALGDLFVPRQVFRERRHLRARRPHHFLAHQVEQFTLVLDVPVQRRGGNPELGRELAERQTIQPDLL